MHNIPCIHKSTSIFNGTTAEYLDCILPHDFTDARVLSLTDLGDYVDRLKTMCGNNIIKKRARSKFS